MGAAPPQGDLTLGLKRETVTIARTGTLFDAAALTDSAVVWAQPANSILLWAYMNLDVVFTSTGALVTNLDVTLGDAGDNDGLLVHAMNLTSDAANSRYTTKGALWDATAGTLFKATATNWTAYSTAIGANLSTLTAGQVTFTFVYLLLQ